MSGWNMPDDVTLYECPVCGVMTDGGGDVGCACQARHEQLADEAMALAEDLVREAPRFLLMAKKVHEHMTSGRWIDAKEAFREESTLRECWDALEDAANRLA